MGVLGWLGDAWRRRQAMRALRSLSEHQLADIGWPAGSAGPEPAPDFWHSPLTLIEPRTDHRPRPPALGGPGLLPCRHRR